ncbi:NADPH-dependent FMN reductase [Enterobacillus tribolii]|uniref:SsuE family FMN reductase n=1 Tax=Enterobacillus tribolii TaxID=1487935 RepID=A0A370QMJ3_9GAMM|nr:NADPH-dependent FMN reductase [Enterobacillus tribolii]MBW7982427.1 NADPH-dependent FMN reductase [Enterobacillus tribolii]RDK89593.1 SsuE family FMN reductase [Enterobacillus tribolii]
MLVITLAGSPQKNSRSSAVLNFAHQWLASRDVNVASYGLQNFSAEELLGANTASPRVQSLINALIHADGLIVATPVYKAAYSGALKTILDLLPERALEHKVVLPIATAGSPGHLLALDYALKPVLSALKAQEVLHGIFADDSQITRNDQGMTFSPSLQLRLDEALNTFLHTLERRRTSSFTPAIAAV